MREDGFTLLEALLALAILGITLAGLVPAFQAFLDGNTVCEERSNAVAAAQQVLTTLRQSDPGSLPSSGSSPILPVRVGQHEYEVVTRFCVNPSYCDSATRHIVVEVSFAGKTVHTVESVFTRMR